MNNEQNIPEEEKILNPWQVIIGAIFALLFIGGGIYSSFIVAHSFLEEITGGFVIFLIIFIMLVWFALYLIMQSAEASLSELKREIINAFKKRN